MVVELTGEERQLLALALLGLGDRQREIEGLQERVLALALKLDVQGLLLQRARDWLKHVEKEGRKES